MRMLYSCKMLLIAILILLPGCARPPVKSSMPALPAFPPQEVMESGDYAAFLARNEKTLKESKEDEGLRATALFNLGFLHSYSASPYLNPNKALAYFKELIRKYPQTPWAFQAKVWVELLEKNIAAEGSRKRLQGRMKSKDSTINALQDEVKRSREAGADIGQIEREMKTKDSVINELEEQIKRSREIDAEIDRIERELLQ